MAATASLAHAQVAEDAAAVQLIRTRLEKTAPGTAVAAAILTPAGTRTYFEGVTGNPHQPKPDADTLFEIGSVTKTFTAALLAEMVGRGEVRLDTPLRSLLPTHVKLGKEEPRAITLEDLSAHRSGLPRLPTGLRFLYVSLRNMSNPYADYIPEDLWKWFDGRDVSSVGNKVEYSNLAVGTLGAVLARRLGVNYEQAVRTRLLAPLGMPNTFIEIPAARRPLLAQPHDEKGRAVPAWDLPAIEGAGALRSNLGDMITWLRANIEQHPPLSAMLYTPRAEMDKDIQVGLGWIISKDAKGTVIWHNGGTGGSRSFIGFDPVSREGVVVLTNSAVEADSLAMSLLRTLGPKAEQP